MIRRIKNWRAHRKLWQKLLEVTLSVSAIPLVLIIIVTYFSTVKIAKVQIKSRLDAMIDSVGNSLSHNLSITDNVIEGFIYSDDFLCMVESASAQESASQEIRNSLQELNRQLTRLFDKNIRIRLIFPNNISYTDAGAVLFDDTFSELPFQSLSHSSRYVTCNNDTVSLCYPVANLYRGRDAVAVLQFDVPTEQFLSAVSVGGADEYIFVIQNDNGETLYIKSKTEKDYGNVIRNLLKRTENNTVRIHNETYLYRPLYLEQFHWNISVLIPQSVLYQNIPSMLIFCFLIGIICLIIVSIFSIASSLKLSRRIYNIGSEMALFGNGELEANWIHIDPTADEIGRLSSMFHQMIEKINLLVIEQYKNEIKSKEEQLKILQNQINPHFLYNCMDTINWRCIMNNDEKTSKFANNLAEFYRTCLNKGNTKTKLADEFRNIRAYIYLQMDMHDDTFRYEEEVDPAIMEYECVNLMLQPIVENAIGHGLEMESGTQGLIRIAGGFSSPEQNEIELKIFNSGKPIDPSVASDVIAGKIGYGLSNVVNRIRLYFGADATLFIEPTDCGTECIIRIPARRWQP